MDIGRRIIELRESKGWTTNRLANLCGLSQSFLRSVEMNEKGISVESLELICDTLGITLKAFFDIPGLHDTHHDTLLRQIERLNEKQKSTLSAFLETIRE